MLGYEVLGIGAIIIGMIVSLSLSFFLVGVGIHFLRSE